MKKLTGRVLVIADVHQCLYYADKALEEEFDYVVFLGDWFDCFEEIDNKRYFSVENVCYWINDLFERLGDRAIWLVGNHDIAYLSTYVKQSFRVDKRLGYICAGYKRNKARNFNKYINPEWVKSLELCTQVGDYVLSHAGFHVNHFQPRKSALGNIRSLYDQWEREKMIFSNEPFHWIGQVGECRGGVFDVGSPIWLDWDDEFEPLDDVRQIVGHTVSYKYRAKSLDENRTDYCIDADRTCYAIIDNEQVVIKEI